MTQMSQNEFLEIAQLLRAGEFICEHTHEKAYLRLRDPDVRDACNQFFEPFNEVIEEAGSEEAFFLTYLDPEHEAARASTQAVIQDFHTSGLRAITIFFDDLHGIIQDDEAFMPGYTFLYSDLLSKIQNSETHKARLVELAVLFGTNAQKEADQLTHILNRVVGRGCLKLIDKKDGRYCVTGKMTYLYSLAQFIAPYTQPSEAEETEESQEDTQADLFGAE